MYFVAALFFVGCDAVYASCAECVETMNHQVYRFETALCHYRFHSVQFHLGCITGHCNTKVVTHYLVANLVHYFRDNRINLTRHDGRTRLHSRKVEFSQTTTRTATQQTKVIADLVHFDSQSAQSRRITYHARGI